jgi:hypothetical protein
MMIHLLGYLGLALNLLSMTRKNLLTLRVLSATANIIYIVYGVMLGAPPVVIGCTVAVIVHDYHIVKLIYTNRVKNCESE